MIDGDSVATFWTVHYWPGLSIVATGSVGSAANAYGEAIATIVDGFDCCSVGCAGLVGSLRR